MSVVDDPTSGPELTNDHQAEAHDDRGEHPRPPFHVRHVRPFRGRADLIQLARRPAARSIARVMTPATSPQNAVESGRG